MRELIDPSLALNEVLNFIQDQMHRDASDERTEDPSLSFIAESRCSFILSLSVSDD
ncbi:MAG: hypothetical protein IPM86_12840 [Saprospiraceae bacterium]|nr:hypothetical protein [Saprospiraceae bacterium]